MITDRIGLCSVLLPLLIHIYIITYFIDCDFSRSSASTNLKNENSQDGNPNKVEQVRSCLVVPCIEAKGIGESTGRWSLSGRQIVVFGRFSEIVGCGMMKIVVELSANSRLRPTFGKSSVGCWMTVAIGRLFKMRRWVVDELSFSVVFSKTVGMVSADSRFRPTLKYLSVNSRWSLIFNPCLPRVRSISNFPCGLTRNTTDNTVELGFS